MSIHSQSTIHDFEDALADNMKQFEIVDGDLYPTGFLHIRHQVASNSLIQALSRWGDVTRAGFAISRLGIVFSETDAVIPDIVWYSRERFPSALDVAVLPHTVPDLVVEVLDADPTLEARDLKIKLDLYSRQGVREYWIVDWREATVRVYRREKAILQLVAMLTAG